MKMFHFRFTDSNGQLFLTAKQCQKKSNSTMVNLSYNGTLWINPFPNKINKTNLKKKSFQLIQWQFHGGEKKFVKNDI